jgi:catechol 2,3-dioxygenase-like lactoylglutathione lyase family enzyme
LFIPAVTVHSAKNVGAGNRAELATYVVEKGNSSSARYKSGVCKDSPKRKEIMMSSVVISKTEAVPQAEPVDMKLEVVVLGVSDVDRAKAFYENLGWRLDIDVATGGFRGVQMTPHTSEASIIFGKGIASAKSGSAPSLVLAVHDIDAARKALIARGVDVSEVFHYAGGPFNNSVENPRVDGRDPDGRSYFSFASFEDPDGNGWLLQEITMRLPGREWKSSRANAMDGAKLAELLRETAEHHDHYEKTHAEHHWWDWYAPYLSARQNGSSQEEAAAAAGRHMDEVHHVLAR